MEECGAGEFKAEEGCEQCPENTWSEAGATSCSKCPLGQISNAGSKSQDQCYDEFFEPVSGVMYTIQKADGPASGWYLTATSKKRNKNSGYVHTHLSDGTDQGEFWMIKKRMFRKKDCYKIEVPYGKQAGRLLVVHGTATDEGDGRVLVHKTPYNRDEDECWMIEPVYQEDEIFYRLMKATGRHKGKYMVAINRHNNEDDWIWADVTDRESALGDHLWRIVAN